MTTVFLPAVNLLRQWQGEDGTTWREYQDPFGRTVTVYATASPFGEPLPEPQTCGKAARSFAGGAL
jgi:hypothetical protein